MIQPTIGRVVWFWPYGQGNGQDQPNAALIAYVHSDRMVNLAVFDNNGISSGRTSVPLLQDGESNKSGQCCEWMPYQKGQAAKEEAGKDSGNPTDVKASDTLNTSVADVNAKVSDLLK